MKQDVLFIWVPKCAGTSIYKVLEKHGCKKLRDKSQINKFDNSGWVTFGHVSTNYLLEKNIIKNDYFNKAFKFCVVRNPWDRLVSIYKYREFSEIMPFDEFVDFLYKQTMMRSSTIHKILKPAYNFNVSKDILKILNNSKIRLPLPEIGPYNTMGLSQANNQVDWITNEKGKILVDHVCRFENLEEDFKSVCEIIGINDTLPHVNKSEHKFYRKYYNDSTVNKVSQLYKADIEKFGYEF